MSDAIVVMEGVHGRDAQGLGGRPLGKLHGVSLRLGAELAVVDGSAADGTAALCSLLCGRRAVSKGRLLVAGRVPHKSPRLRSQIGALLPQPALPLGFAQVTALLQMWAGRDGAAELLDTLALSALGPRPLTSLSPPEQRAVELALCLALPDPRLLVLYAPFTTLCDTLALQRALRARVMAGCCVVVAGDQGGPLHDGDRRLRLDQGELRAPPSMAAHGLCVQLADADAARQLARQLMAHETLSALQLQVGEQGATLVLRGAELPLLSRAVADIVVADALPLLQLQPLHGEEEAGVEVSVG